jgi:hypothetical protein
MTRSKWFLHGEQLLEVRDHRVMTSFEIWIYQDSQPIVRHSALPLRETVQALGQGRDLLDEAMDRAMADVQAGRLAVAPTLAPALAKTA